MKTTRVVIPIDFSERSRQALREADALTHERGGALTLLHVHPIVELAVMDFTYVQPAEKVAAVCEAAEKKLREWARELSTPAAQVNIQVVTGGPAAEICNLSKDYDLVVMATQGRNAMEHLLMGSVTEKVVKGAHCSVLVVRQKR